MRESLQVILFFYEHVSRVVVWLRRNIINRRHRFVVVSLPLRQLLLFAKRKSRRLQVHVHLASPPLHRPLLTTIISQR